jgi:hypothetical protein
MVCCRTSVREKRMQSSRCAVLFTALLPTFTPPGNWRGFSFTQLGAFFALPESVWTISRACLERGEVGWRAQGRCRRL